MKKLVMLFMFLTIFVVSAEAKKIPYYSATKTLIHEVKTQDDSTTTILYAPAVAVSAVVESIAAPFIALFNISSNAQRK